MENEQKLSNKTIAVAAGFGILASVAAYTFVVRKWHNRWGASDSEVDMVLPGDDIVRRPNMCSTRAITIHAPPSDVWPWLVQMGKGRGGLYSYDWLDIAFGILDKPSSDVIMPEFQSLNTGDTIPLGCNEDTKDDFYVHLAREDEALVIGANDPFYRDRVSWAIVLLPEGRHRTRLIMRVRGDVPMDAQGIVTYALMDPASFVMLRKQMLNLRRLAEKTREHRVERMRALS